MIPKPLISVIIPAHNNKETIGVALESILNQTWENLEIIVVDDNSTDDTQGAVMPYVTRDNRVKYFALPSDDPERVNKRGRNINAGYMSRNFGFEKVTGDFITFQDADDASLGNRIEVQYELLIRHKALHITLDWQKFDGKLLNKKFDVRKFMEENKNLVVRPEELSQLAQETKGIFLSLFPILSRKIDFEIKRLRVINKLFWGSLGAYPGTGNSPLFHKDVLERVRFRKLADRVWPSFTGRGADRDFNFQVAETFKQSVVVFLPVYLWRQNNSNKRYDNNLDAYIIS